MAMAVLATFRLKGRYDIVLATSPPLFVGLSGWVASHLKRARFVFDVRDLWPEVAVKMGELNNPNTIRMAEAIELFLYRKSDLITVVTSSFRDTIEKMGVRSQKIRVISNGTDTQIFFSNDSVEILRIKFNLPSGFIVSFIGNLGLAQGLDHIIETAWMFHSEGNLDVFFLFVGDGPRKSDLMSKAVDKGLSNVIFRERVELPVASEYMNASDALLVPLADDPIYHKFIPSKLFDSMAAAKPVLLSVDGESHRILVDSDSGIWYPAENADCLKDVILELKKDSLKARQMGTKGKVYVEQHFTRRAQALKMLQAFSEMKVRGFDSC